jgi:hypothetical protein
MDDEEVLNSIQWLLNRSWMLRSSTRRTGKVIWMRQGDEQRLALGVEGKFRSATLEACRMELAGPTMGHSSPSGAEPSPAVPSSPVSASTSRRAS